MITNYRIWTNFCPAVVCIEHTVVDPSLINWQKNRRSKKLVWLRGIQSSTFGSWKICYSIDAGILRKFAEKNYEELAGQNSRFIHSRNARYYDCAAARYGFNFGLPEFDFRGVPGGYARLLHRNSIAGVALAVAGLILPLTTALLALGILAFLVFLFLPKQRRFLLYNAFFTTVSAAIMYGVGFVMEQLLAPHQQVRIKVLLGLENDPLAQATIPCNPSLLLVLEDGLEKVF